MRQEIQGLLIIVPLHKQELRSETTDKGLVG